MAYAWRSVCVHLLKCGVTERGDDPGHGAWAHTGGAVDAGLGACLLVGGCSCTRYTTAAGRHMYGAGALFAPPMHEEHSQYTIFAPPMHEKHSQYTRVLALVCTHACMCACVCMCLSL